MRVLSITLATITLFFGFTPSAWAGTELVTPLLVIGPNSSAFQCIVTNATATTKVNVDLTLIDLFGSKVFEADAVPIGPRHTFIQAFTSPRPLFCVVNVGMQDPNLVRVVLVTTDGNDNITGLVQAR